MRDRQRAAALVHVAPRRHVIVDATAIAGDAVRAADGDDGALVVVLQDGILGAITSVADADAADPSTPVLAVADLDPPTTRPDVTAEDLVERLQDEELAWVAITTAGGRFLGAVDGAGLMELARRDELP